MIVPEKRTLYERIGGMKVLSLAVDNFYQKVQDDDHINFFFRWVDMEKQSCKLREYIAHALGAPISYAGKPMHEAHRHLTAIGLNDDHFDRMKLHFITSFQESSVPEELIWEVDKVIEKARMMIVGQKD